ncbi:MAG: hypothetical protein ACPK85_04785 [Methanosarcina sp.]
MDPKSKFKYKTIKKFSPETAFKEKFIRKGKNLPGNFLEGNSLFKILCKEFISIKFDTFLN